MTSPALRRAGLVLAAGGAAIAAYLAVAHYTGTAPSCQISHGCETVQQSEYASLAGIPVAVLGLATYLIIAGALLLDRGHACTAAALTALVGAGFSAYLTYVEVVEIRAICQWCVASALIMLTLAVLTTARLARGTAVNGM